MGLAGLLGEGRRNREKRAAGLRQRAVERGKAQVIADGDAEPAPWQISHHGVFARRIAAQLPVAFPIGQIDVEHVDFIVAGRDLAVRIDQEAAVGGAVGGHF